MHIPGSNWIRVVILGAVIVALSANHAATQSKKAGTPKPRGDVTRRVDLEGPGGHKVVVSLTADRQLDERVFDYLARTLQVVESGLSSAERVAWEQQPGPVAMGWPIKVSITSREGRDVSSYLVKPPPGVDLVRPDILWPTEDLVGGLRANPRRPFPERTVLATTAHAHGGPAVTVTGTIACTPAGGIRDVEVEVDGIAATWSGGSFNVTGPFHAGPARVRVRYRGALAAAGVTARLQVVDDIGVPRVDSVTATIVETATTRTVAIALPPTDCEAWRHGHDALTDYVTITGALPPAGSLTMRRQGGVWATPGSTPAAYAHYDTIVLPTTWNTTYAGQLRATIFHEFAHTIQHVADGNFHHWNLDLGRYSYARWTNYCSTTNRGFAFNEGWARYWASAQGGGTLLACGKQGAFEDWTADMIAARLQTMAVPLGANNGARAAGMRAVLIGAPGTIHTLRDFERRYCVLYPNPNPNCADVGAPARPAPAPCPPGFDETANHCHLKNIIPKQTRPRGTASTPTACGAGFELIAGLCYSTCEPGFRGIGPICWQDCPGGLRDDGAYCAKPPAYGRGPGYGWQVGDKPWSLDGARGRCEAQHPGGCEQHGGIIYPTCRSGFHAVGCCICSPDCPAGMPDVGVSCQKQTRGRQITVPTQCPVGKQYDSGLCYPACPTGFVGAGPTCWQATCPAGYQDIGAMCYRAPEVILKV